MFIAELEEGSVERVEVFDLDRIVRRGDLCVSRREERVCREGEVSLSSDHELREGELRGVSVGAVVAELQQVEAREGRGVWRGRGCRRLLGQAAVSAEPGTRRVLGAAAAATLGGGREVGVRLEGGRARIGRRCDVEFREEELRAMQLGAACAPLVVIGSLEKVPEGLCEGVVVGGSHGRAERRGEKA